VCSPWRSEDQPNPAKRAWTDQVSNAIANLETNTDRVLAAARALAIIDDVVEGKLMAYELAIVHGIPKAWIEVTLGYVTRMVQGTGRVLPLDAGGWYAFQGHEQPYEVAPGFEQSPDADVMLKAVDTSTLAHRCRRGASPRQNPSRA
jgi:hypothetical protein